MGKFSDAIAKSEKENEIKKRLFLSDQNDDLKIKKTNITTFSIASNSVDDSSQLDEKIVAYHQPKTYEAEQFRVLKTGLFFPKQGGTPRIIMITSAAPNEGKSFLAANLAVTFARSVDSHVLLIDCDLRNPTVHKMFGLKGEPAGLSDLLSEKINLESVLYKSRVDKLTILPAGKISENPTELLSSVRMTNLLEEVKSRYKDRYIIIDSPPPLLTAEAIAISSQVDGIILVVKHEKTNRKLIKKMIDMLDKDKIVGVVFNQYDVRTDKYYGTGKYGNYYHKL